MATLPASVAAFLGCRTIAVAGVSRDTNQPANLIYRKLKSLGYRVFALNPNASQVEGDTCYPDIAALPEPVEAVMIATRPDIAAQIVRESADAGVGHVWFHRSFGQGSVSDDALSECRQRGLQYVEGGCPMMYCEPVDFGHRCMKWILGVQKRVPA